MPTQRRLELKDTTLYEWYFTTTKDGAPCKAAVMVEYYYFTGEDMPVIARYAFAPKTGAKFGLTSERDYYNHLGIYTRLYGAPTEHHTHEWCR